MCNLVDMKLDLDRNFGQPFVIEKELLEVFRSASYTWHLNAMFSGSTRVSDILILSL